MGKWALIFVFHAKSLVVEKSFALDFGAYSLQYFGDSDKGLKQVSVGEVGELLQFSLQSKKRRAPLSCHGFVFLSPFWRVFSCALSYNTFPCFLCSHCEFVIFACYRFPSISIHVKTNTLSLNKHNIFFLIIVDIIYQD